MAKVLMFDLGGVLIVNNMFEELQRLSQGALGENELKTKWLQSPVVRQFELGLCSPEVFANAMIEEFALGVSPSEFIASFTDWPKGFYEGAEDLLHALRQDYATGCLSNSNELHWTTDVTSHFKHSYSSHLLEKIKPDVEVFEFVTADVGCQPNEIVFFDDAPLNVDAARGFGWDAHLTVGYAELVRVLHESGFMTK